MRYYRGPFIVLRLFSLVLLLLGGALFVFQVERFEKSLEVYPPGQVIAGVPVGGLNHEAAGERLLEAYTRPVELIYDQAVIQLYPIEANFTLDIEAMLAQADEQAATRSFWQGFVNFHLGKSTTGGEVPLSYNYSEERLRSYLLRQVSARYDRPPSASAPYPGTLNFTAGIYGAELDIDNAIPLIETALQSLTVRQVTLPLQLAEPPDPPFQNLDVLLRQTVSLSGFDGTIGVYVLDLETAEEVHFIYQDGAELPTEPDAAFTASSTMKIPVMVSAFRRVGDNPTQSTVDNIYRMIAKSDNTATDWVIENLIENFYGPLRVTEDMVTLGMENTFLAGYFYPGAPLLRVYQTPGSLRSDTVVFRDPYNQTSPSEMGTLLADIYQCAYNEGGSLLAVFPDEIKPAECRAMIDYLIEDRNPLLLQAGVPDGTRIAHKHGWISDAFTGVIHDMSDAAIVFTPGGDFVITVYMYHPTQLIFEPGNKLISNLARATYNFFNPPK